MVQREIHTLLTNLFLGHFCADDLTDEILLLHCGRNGWSAKIFYLREMRLVSMDEN